MAGKGGKKSSRGGVIIKKYDIVEGGHHGGAWKVAYADFVTAMMAFFLLMWLLNATTEDQRKGLADYFSPNNLMSHASSGTGEPFGGHTAFDEGALASDRGSVQVVVGKAPVPDQTEDGTDPVTTSYHRARVGEGVGQGPMVEDQNADDETQASLGEAGTRRPPGPGGPADTNGTAETTLNRDAATLDNGPKPVAAASARGNPARPDQAPASQSPSDQTPARQVAGNRAAGDQASEGQAGGDHAQGDQARREQAQGAQFPGEQTSRDQIRAEQLKVSRIATEQLQAERARQEEAAFQQAAEQIRAAMRADPELAGLSKQLAIDMTPEGLRIQIMDEIKLPMFPSGSATPNERARLLIQKVVPVLMRLNQSISIDGHTDAAPFPGPERTNWELSAERANATRRLLTDSGIPQTRIRSVSGHADRDPLLPADPMAAENRRIAIMVLRETPLPRADGRPPKPR